MYLRNYSILIFSFMLFASSTAFARDATVTWSPNSESDLSGYKIYYKIGSAPTYTDSVGADVSKEINKTTIILLDDASNYYLAATAYNTTGVESLMSDVVVFNEITPPTVSIAAPLNNDTVVGTVSITANASDTSGIARVEFYVDGALQGTKTASPYSFDWNTMIIAEKMYSIYVKGFDTVGNEAQSTTIQVTVSHDIIAPTVSIDSQINNMVLRGNITVSVTAADDATGTGIDRVELYANDEFKAVSNSAPYTLIWNSGLDTDAPYTVYARAYDKSGNFTNSSIVNVTLDNTPPVLNISTVATLTIQSSQTLSGTVSDNHPGATVSITVGGVGGVTYDAAVSSSAANTPLSWSYIANNLPVGNNTITVTARDAVGNVNALPTFSIVRAEAGDIDGVGGVVLNDAQLAMKSSVGKVTLSDKEIIRGDVVAPFGVVDTGDAIVILGIIVGL